MPNQQTDLIPYLFIAAMIVIGGLVAWVADTMGRKIGKKRLSFLGIRPRHTATLIIVIAGLLIPILTAASLYLLSSDVRQWIQKGRGAIEEARQKTEEVAELDKKVKALDSQKGELEGKVEGLTGRTAELSRKVQKQQDQLRTSTQRLSAAQGRVGRLSTQLAVREKRLAETNRALKSTNTQISELRSKREQLAKTFRSLEGSFDEAIKQREEAFARIKEIDDQIVKLESGAANLRSERDGLNAQIVKSKEEIQAYQSTIRDQQEEIRRNGEELDNLQTKLADATKIFGASFESSRLRNMIFASGEEVARVQLPPSLSPQAAQNAYNGLLATVRAKALERKARTHAVLPPAGLTDRQVGDPPRFVSIEEQEKFIVNQLTARRSEVVLVGRSVFNSFEGEYVLVDFVAFENKFIYPEGKVIVEKRVDGRKSEVEVLRQIQEFVTANVRSQAMRDGMRPPAGPSSQLGSISEEDLFDLIKEIRSYNQVVRLQAVANSPIYAGDRLDLLFRVRL